METKESEGRALLPAGGISSLALKLAAMALMLCDHIWYVFMQDAPGFEWMTWIGRLAFPIFAYQIAEGFVHTHSFRRYWLRMLFFALISEIPFNLAVNGTLLYSGHQNVMFTFCIVLPVLAVIRQAQEKGSLVYALAAFACTAFAFVLGYAAQTDYYGLGVLTVILFYLCRDARHAKLWQVLGMLFIHLGLCNAQTPLWCYLRLDTYARTAQSWQSLGGYEFPLPGFSLAKWTPGDQGLAALALPLIWLCNGKPGKRSRAIQYACYAFYPVHLLVLGLLAKVI